MDWGMFATASQVPLDQQHPLKGASMLCYCAALSSCSKQPASLRCLSLNPVLELNFGAVLCGLFTLGSLREAA